MNQEQEKQLNSDLNTEAGQRILSAIKQEVKFGMTVIDADSPYMTYYRNGQQNVANFLHEIMLKDARSYEKQEQEMAAVKALQDAEKQQDDFYDGD